jgi:RNA polymerase sigma factor (sigma-70 family)
MTASPGRARIEHLNRFSDSDLVKECLQGKEAAWSKLINKYKNLIFSIPVRYGFSEEDCADIFQAVCMDLLTELPRLREPNALAGWLIRVTRNKCYQHKQALQRVTVKEDVPEDLDAAAPVEEPGDVTIRLQQEQMLREALSDLSPRCRKLVHMLFFEMPARPYEQVAKELELALGSIGFIRRRCLEKLRQRLERIAP